MLAFHCAFLWPESLRVRLLVREDAYLRTSIAKTFICWKLAIVSCHLLSSMNISYPHLFWTRQSVQAIWSRYLSLKTLLSAAIVIINLHDIFLNELLNHSVDMQDEIWFNIPYNLGSYFCWHATSFSFDGYNRLSIVWLSLSY